MPMKIAAAAACLALSLAPAAHAAGPNLVVNGSFEDSVIPTGTWVIQPSIKGWTGAPTSSCSGSWKATSRRTASSLWS